MAALAGAAAAPAATVALADIVAQAVTVPPAVAIAQVARTAPRSPAGPAIHTARAVAVAALLAAAIADSLAPADGGPVVMRRCTSSLHRKRRADHNPPEPGLRVRHPSGPPAVGSRCPVGSSGRLDVGDRLSIHPFEQFSVGDAPRQRSAMAGGGPATRVLR
ncbi:MAG TPA: hypothetical protein VK698_09185 [Kofleriaceae bacterium]|nr:hypothetical protein [Kofleriaceae bacterium]